MEQRAERLATGGAAVALTAFLLWRSIWGVTFADDGYYVSLALRFAQGARVFADELFIQSLGSIATGAFARMWLAVAGVEGLALGLRVLYVVVAMGTAAAVHAALAPRFGRLAAATGAVALVLAPPFNIMALSYNSVAMLALLAMGACGFRAVTDRDARWAAAAALLGSLSVAVYPPMVVPVVLAGIAVLAASRSRAVATGVAGGVAGAVVVGLVWLFATASVADVADTLEFAATQRVRTGELGDLVMAAVRTTRSSLSVRALLPMWLLAAGATLIPHGRLRALALMLIPVAAAVPTAMSVFGDAGPRAYGRLGTAYLVICVAALLVPVAVRAWRTRSADAGVLLAVTAVPGIAGYLAVTVATQSGWYWAIPVIGAAPLVLALMCLWTEALRDDLGLPAAATAAAVFIGVLLVASVATPFKSPPLAQLTAAVPAGAYAGIRVEPSRLDAIEQLEAAGRRWVRPDESVLAINGPGIYPLVGGRIETPSVWLSAGSASAATVRYFDERDAWPDVVFVNPPLSEAPTEDPLLRRIAERYRPVGEAAGFSVLRAP